MSNEIQHIYNVPYWRHKYLRFINDSHYVQTGNGASILCSLSLSIIKVCRHSHNGMCHLLAQICLSCFFHFYQNHCRYLLRSKRLRFRSYFDLKHTIQRNN